MRHVNINTKPTSSSFFFSPGNQAVAKVNKVQRSTSFGVPNANSIKQMLLDWCRAKTRSYEVSQRATVIHAVKCSFLMLKLQLNLSCDDTLGMFPLLIYPCLHICFVPPTTSMSTFRIFHPAGAMAWRSAPWCTISSPKPLTMTR